MSKQLVTLVGGDADGDVLAVEPMRLKIVVTHDRGEKAYAAGEWGTETGASVVTRLVDFELYERVDAATFRLVAA